HQGRHRRACGEDGAGLCAYGRRAGPERSLDAGIGRAGRCGTAQAIAARPMAGSGRLARPTPHGFGSSPQGRADNMSRAIEIEFEGRRIAARPGESLAAALTAAGILALRTTHRNAERGIFCGMGVCQDCLVEVNGKPAQRACMTMVDRPLVVRREMHARPLPRVTESGIAAEITVECPEVLVIGAGPGGLAAAIAAREAGAEVVLVDERSKPGGQYFKQLAGADSILPGPDAQHREGLALIGTARRLGVTLRDNVLVWGAFQPDGFAAVTRGRSLRFRPKATIIATGAYERPWPVPGWTLPGVM